MQHEVAIRSHGYLARPGVPAQPPGVEENAAARPKSISTMRGNCQGQFSLKDAEGIFSVVVTSRLLATCVLQKSYKQLMIRGSYVELEASFVCPQILQG